MFKSLKVNNAAFLDTLQEKKGELCYIVGVGDLNIDRENSSFSFSCISEQAELNFIRKLTEYGLTVNSN